MLSREDNELVCRTGPDTTMGKLFRRYWHPFLLSSELPEPDGPPVRVKLLGEELVAFRDTMGEVGLLEERCPHRGASLYYGINDQCGLTCVYHGFAFDIHGKCIATPSDAPGSNFKDKVRAKAYPVIESAGVLWAYMGPPAKQPRRRRRNHDDVDRRTPAHAGECVSLITEAAKGRADPGPSPLADACVQEAVELHLRLDARAGECGRSSQARRLAIEALGGHSGTLAQPSVKSRVRDRFRRVVG